MSRRRTLPARHFLALLASLALLSLCPASANAVSTEDFTFIQVSDLHAPQAKSKEVVAGIRTIGEVNLAPFGLVVSRPEFVIATGDLTEFGGGNGWWQEYLSYWKDCGLDIYQTLGNHDNTWHAGVRALREMGQGPCYSFDRNGCHFVALMSATIQDPRPSFGEEQIDWLKRDLQRIDRKTPLFVFFHHPLGGTEFASRYDYDRVLDVLRGYNTVLLMSGHSHGYVSRPFEIWDQITGGSTFATQAGLTFVSVKNGVVRVAYHKDGEPTPTVKMFEKTIPEVAPYPELVIDSPKTAVTSDRTLVISARVSGLAGVTKATYTIDDEINGGLVLDGTDGKWSATGSAAIADLLPGSHYLRVDFEAGKDHHNRSVQFFYETAAKPTEWRSYIKASSKSTPTVSGGVLFIGSNDGRLRAIDVTTGFPKWMVDTGAEVLTQPLVMADRVVVGNGLGAVIAYSLDGKELWRFAADEAVYSSPVEVDGKVVFGCNSGKLYALDATSGNQVWVNDDAKYAIESKPFAWNGRVYYGAWDEYVRCIDAKTGSLIWKQQGEGSAVEKAKRYYSPADCGPVVVDGKLQVADRDYMLTILDATTGERLGSQKQVAATGVSEDGKHGYLRKSSGELVKVDPVGNQVWSINVQMDIIPTPPVEKDGIVFVTSKKGLLSAVAADSGKLIWQYQASPQLFVMAPVGVDDKNAYVVSFDGYLTAVKRDWKP